MTEKNKKNKSFDWNVGVALKSEDYEPIEEIHEVGFNRIADGLLADPVERKVARKEKLLKPLKHKKGEFFTEESSSGLYNDYTPSEAARLINQNPSRLKGINRFGKKEKE